MAYFENSLQWHSYRFGSPASAIPPNHTGYSFLTPPRPTHSIEPAPFRISGSDNTSLSMKRRHHVKHDNSSQHEESISHDGLTTRPDDSPTIKQGTIARSTSLPCLPGRRLACRGRCIFTSAQRKVSQHSPIIRQRGWTLPTKALSTRGLSNLNPLFKHRSNASGASSHLTPAVITLRRATTNLHESTNITFFPPPKFERTRSGLISTFLHSIARDGLGRRNEQEESIHDDFLRPHLDRDRLARMAGKDIAKPAVTRVIVEPVILDVNAHDAPFRQRRCSTKYISGSSIHEIIWDENDTPSSGSGDSRAAETPRDSPYRRQSVAVAQLETQLARITPQPVVHAVEAQEHTNRCEPTTSLVYRRSFPEMLNLCLSRFVNEAALWNLPRSKAFNSRMRSNSFVISGLNVHQTLNETEDVSQQRARKFAAFQFGQKDESLPSIVGTPSEMEWNRHDVDPAGTQPSFDAMYQHQSKQPEVRRRYGLRRNLSAKISTARDGRTTEADSSDTVPLLS